MKLKGFTLIELLIVVAIIGILTAIAVPNLRQAHIRAQVARSKMNLHNLDLAVKQLMLDHYCPNVEKRKCSKVL